MRVPSCFPVERYGELHGFFEVSWIDENVLSLDHDLSALSEERCEDIHDGNLVGIELSNEASGSHERRASGNSSAGSGNSALRRRKNVGRPVQIRVIRRWYPGTVV